MTDAERLIFGVAEKLGMMAKDVAENMTASELIKWAKIGEHDQEKSRKSNLKKIEMIARAQQS